MTEVANVHGLGVELRDDRVVIVGSIRNNEADEVAVLKIEKFLTDRFRIVRGKHEDRGGCVRRGYDKVELSPVGLLVKNEDLKNVRGPVPFPDFGGFLPDDGCDCLIAHLELLSIVYVRAVRVLAQAVPQSAHHMPREIQAGQKIGAGMLRRTQAFALGSMKDDPGTYLPWFQSCASGSS